MFAWISHPQAKCRKLRLPASMFFLILVCMVLGTGWHEKPRLVLRGQASVDAPPLIRVRWNSGHGFNEYEQQLFQLHGRPKSIQQASRISIGAVGRKYPASLASRVICSSVLADGKKVMLKDFVGKPILAGDELLFEEAGAVSFSLPTTFHVGFKFKTDNGSGVAFVVVNGDRSEHDLYMANVEAKFKQIDYWLLGRDGSFVLEMNLPRYRIDELEVDGLHAAVESVRLLRAELHGKGRIVDLLNGQPANLGSIRFMHVLDGMRSFFHPAQFCQQTIFAMLTVWMLLSLARFCKRLGSLRSCLLADRRPWFWLMLTGCLVVFGAWLAAFWPGVMSIDSLKVWRAAMMPNMYLNDHPLLNVIFYKYLRHLWNDPAVVAVAQVFLAALLVSWFGFWIYRQGVSGKAVFFWLLFVLSSIPVGVYNVMLWKDVPFALLVVFWACQLVVLHQEKRHERLRWTRQRIFALLLLGLALGLIRHNGLVYFAVLPLLVLLLRLAPAKKALAGLAILLLAVGIGLSVLHGTRKVAGTRFLSEELRKYASRMSLHDAAEDSVRTMRDYLSVLNINQTQRKWDKFHYYFQDRQSWWFLRVSGWNDAYPYQKENVRFPRLNKIALRIYEQSYEKPWVWLSWNPVWLLALLPLLTLLFPWLPNTAVLGAVLLAGAFPLVYLQIFNWRYYYFLYFGLLFLPAFVSFDLACRKKGPIS